MLRFDESLPDDAWIKTHLNSKEQARFHRFLHPGAQVQFARSRGTLRTVLGSYLDLSPLEVQFDYTADGKPELASERRLHFNVSHTDGVAAIAVATVPVGVDVESERSSETANGLVDRFFSPVEREQYHALPVELQSAAFLRGWTCKEALLKGVGCGARGLERCVVDLDPRRSPHVVELAGPAAACGPDWQLLGWRPTDSTAAALAVWGTQPLHLD